MMMFLPCRWFVDGWMDGWMSIELRCVCCGREGPQVGRYMLYAGEVVGIANRTTL